MLNGSHGGRLATAASEMRASGFTVHEARFDMTDEAAVKAAFAALDEKEVAVDDRTGDGRLAPGHRDEFDQRFRDGLGKLLEMVTIDAA